MNTEDVRDAGITDRHIELAVLDVDTFVRAAKLMISREAALHNEDPAPIITSLVSAMAAQYAARIASLALPKV